MAHRNLSPAGGSTHSMIKGVYEEPSGARDALGTRRLRPASGSANHPSLIPPTRRREKPPRNIGILLERHASLVQLKKKNNKPAGCQRANRASWQTG